ncbi:MAG: flagellar synthesis regulator FleN, partial [Gammaproteobacteria bacterium]|nr:flagellar synthesis regulator FleN [Gammaproteobacteria bacterium]
MTQLSKQQKVQILSELDAVIDRVDLLLIDTAAGISSNVMDFNVIAQEIIVVVSPEPTAITDAYALMKVLALKYAEKNCQVIVNLASTAQQGSEVFRQLNLVTERFLD